MTVQPYMQSGSHTLGTDHSESTHPSKITDCSSVSTSNASSDATLNKPLPPPPTAAQFIEDIFSKDLPRLIIKTELPFPRQRIERTDQLIYCNTLLLQDIISPETTKVMFDEAEVAWLQVIKNSPMEEERILWLATIMVEVFIADTVKDPTEVAEIIALGPILQKEPYRKLISTIINMFEETRILDVNVLQGLVQLVQVASPDFVVSDDLIRILSILRAHLESTHQQSTAHVYHLILAVSRILDFMAEHKVQDLDRVLQHEPLSELLLGLKGSSDPYLVYQSCYALQALQYVPDNETALQGVLRHSTSVVDSLVKVSAVFKLDLVSVLKGLGSLQESLSGNVGVATTTYEGASSLMGRVQGIFAGQKQPWYLAIRAAYAFSQAGQLKDLKQLILESPCRHDPSFQWGVCQLLGEISIDPAWDVATRQQAISFLGHLYQHDHDWGYDKSVKAWIFTIISKLGFTMDQDVSAVAQTLLQALKQDCGASVQQLYPLGDRLAIPASYPVLAKVHNIPYVEYNLHKLRLQRLKDTQLPVYIPPMAKANLQARDEDLFLLMEKVEEFLTSDRQVMLVLGDSGSGKSTFNMHLESELLQSYKSGGRIPLFINLPAIEQPNQDLIEKHLKTNNFNDNQIQEMKQHRQFVLICDGYDESQQLVNLHVTNSFNQPGQWDTKVVISCRSQYLGRDYRSRFIPQSGSHYTQPASELFQEAVIAPYSRDQIKQYVEQYVPLEPRAWTTQDYMEKLTTIPNLMDLVKNPFLLTLALEALPSVTEGKQDLSAIKISRIQLYDIFVRHWMDVNKRRLESNSLTDQERLTFDQILDAGFTLMGTEYSTRLASAIFEKQEGNPVVRYVHLKDKNTWRAEFFGPDPEVRLLRESSLLVRSGQLFQFLHRSIQEYFLSRAVFDPSIHDDDANGLIQQESLDCSSFIPLELNTEGPLFTQNLIKEPSVIHFLCERVKQHPFFEMQLRTIIELSKTDPTAAIGAANAITILVRAGVRFNGTDLRGVQIAGADLSDGQFDSAQLQGANLKGANLTRSWLRNTDFSDAQMDDVRFGELPSLEVRNWTVENCSYSPDGKYLAIGNSMGELFIFDTTTWTKVCYYQEAGGDTGCIAFSPNSQQLAFRNTSPSLSLENPDSTFRLWDIARGESLFLMEGHRQWVSSLAFSLCCKRIASGGRDGSVRLWSTETGECLHVVEGLSDRICSLTYSPDGRRLISGGENGTIRWRDSETGELVDVWRFGGNILNFVFSSDGQWCAFVVMDVFTKIHVMNTATRKPAIILDNVDQIKCLAFSPNGQWIVASGESNIVRLWDISTGHQVSILSGHSYYVDFCTFSPDGLQIAFGDNLGTVRLWDVETVQIAHNSQDVTDIVYAVAYSLDGRSIMSGRIDGSMQQWDSTTGTSLPHPPGSTDGVRSFALSPKGCQLAIGGTDGVIRLRNLPSGAVERILLGHANAVTCVAYSPCNRWIVACSQDYNTQTTLLWDLDDPESQGQVIEAYFDKGIKFVCLAFSPTDHWFMVGAYGRGSEIRFYDPRATHPRSPLRKINMRSRINAINVSPDGQRFAIAGGIRWKTVQLQDVRSDKPSINLRGHEIDVRCAAFSPCGHWIVSGGRDMTIRIWYSPTGQTGNDWSCVAVVAGCSDTVKCVAWNPVVPMEFVTGSKDRTVRVWRILSNGEGGSEGGRNGGGGGVSVQMVWGSYSGRLISSGVTLKGVTGLNPIYQKLLVQRGAIDDTLSSEGGQVG